MLLSKRLLPLLAALPLLAGCGGGHHAASQPNPVHHSKAFIQSVEHPTVKVAPTFGAIHTTLWYDDVTLSRIPAGAAAVGCYATGSFANCGAAAFAFPHAVRVPIVPSAGSVIGGVRMVCLDVEPGDASPGQAGPWAAAERRLGVRPCVYASISTMPSVEANLAGTFGGGWHSIVYLWDAHWTFTPTLDGGFDATQWYGGNVIDKSLATDGFLGLNVPPPPPPGPSHKTITHWQGARNSSFSAYRHHGCKTAVDSKPCRTFGGRVEYFQGKLWTVYHRWSCWGPHARTKSLVCWVVRPTVSHWSKARDATDLVMQRHGCNGPVSFPKPRHTPLCDHERAQRDWFARRVDVTFKAYS